MDFTKLERTGRQHELEQPHETEHKVVSCPLHRKSVATGEEGEMTNRAKTVILKALEEKGPASTKELCQAIVPEFYGEQALSQGELLRLLPELEGSGAIRSSVDESTVGLVWELTTR
jgi:hypothetical protein